jgi:hypothetical protein
MLLEKNIDIGFQQPGQLLTHFQYPANLVLSKTDLLPCQKMSNKQHYSRVGRRHYPSIA